MGTPSGYTPDQWSHQVAADNYTRLENAIRDMLCMTMRVDELPEDFDIDGKGVTVLKSHIEQMLCRLDRQDDMLSNQKEVITHYQRALDGIAKIMDTTYPFVSDTGSNDHD